MPTSSTTNLGRVIQRFVAFGIGSALLVGGLVAPATAAESSEPIELVDSLVVKYVPWAPVTDSAGDPNGASQVTSDVELAVGENLGLGFRTIDFDQPIPVDQAKAIAAQLDNSAAITIAEPNYVFTDQSDLLIDQATISQSINSQLGNWGLDRIDQETRSLDGNYTYSSSGLGVIAYIVDSGIRATHSEFMTNGSSRVLPGYSAIDGELPSVDYRGHGTHVAGIVGSNTYGVAKEAKLVPVKVLDQNGTGDTAGLIEGINWIIQNHTSSQPAVANFSLGPSSRSYTITSVNNAITGLINDGVQPVVASGNSNDDACYYSPANSPGTITVNASNTNDERASFSNFGSCTDIYAPGTDILSTGHLTDSSTARYSGTSMAAPFVTGVIANILSESPTSSPNQIWTMLSAEATNSVASDAYGTPVRLLHQPSDGWTTSTKAASALQLLAEQEAARVAAEQAAAAEAARVAAEQAAAEAARVAAEQAAAFAATQNTLRNIVGKRRLVTVTVTAPAGSTTAIQIYTTERQRVAYQQKYRAREKYQVTLSSGKVVTRTRMVTKFRTAYKTVNVKVWKTVNNVPTSASYSVRIKKAGTYRTQVATPYGTATSSTYRVR